MLKIVYSADYLKYDFGPGHPFTPDRWEAVVELLEQMDLAADWIKPDPATESDVLAIHERAFVEAIKAASVGRAVPYPLYFGLETGDVPVFPGMHEATCALCGGSQLAGRLVAEGVSKRVLQLGGGLHHAMPGRASGFCVYNDPAFTIEALRARGLRVAYVDIDVHHGDGVQAIYYNDPDVLTLSLHESGRFLFPGTGEINELGNGRAIGTSVNVPLSPGTQDASYLESFEEVVPRVLRHFDPDVLVIQSGADAHYLDPLAHLSLTTHAYETLFRRLIVLSEEITEGRMVVALGGGYAFDSTTRVWALLAHCLADAELPERLPAEWMDRWGFRRESISPDLHDRRRSVSSEGRDSSVVQANQQTVGSLLEALEELE